MKKADIFEFYRRLAELNPSPETELQFGNTYQLLVAVVLSAQATDVGVNKATRLLFQDVKTPQQMLDLGEEGLKQHIKTIGLFNGKAKNVIALSEILVRDHGGEVPADRDTLVELPGVGRKTANVVMNCAFGAETFESTPTSSASVTAPASLRERRCWRSKKSWKAEPRRRFALGRITG